VLHPLFTNQLALSIAVENVGSGGNNSLVKFHALVGQGAHPFGLKLLLLLGG
jgi:hypothetical protein